MIDQYTALSELAFGVPYYPAPDELPDEDEEIALPSEIDGVTDAQWTAFVHGMISAELDAVSDSNTIGMFGLSPRRLADFGLVHKLRRTQTKKGRTVWAGKFVPPLTSEQFLKSARAQYRVFVQSVTEYARKLAEGAIEKDPAMSLSGALALLHRAGPKGLESWTKGTRFPATTELYERVAGIF